MKHIAIAILLLLTTAAMAQQIPTEEQKIAALKLAYKLNGNSMVRWGSIDLTMPIPKAVQPVWVKPTETSTKELRGR